jgi:hypothetical protein
VARRRQLFHARSPLQATDAVVQLMFDQFHFLRRAFVVDHAHAHRNRHLIHVANAVDDLVGHRAELQVSPLFGHGSAMPERQLLRGEPVREGHDLIRAAARDRRAVRNAAFSAGFVREPEPPHVLDAIERDAAGHRDPAALVLDRGYMRRGIVGE